MSKRPATQRTRRPAARTYRGKPGLNDFSVFVSIGGREQTFKRGFKFAWGDTGPRAAVLAHELVFDVTDDPALTNRVYRRFLHRTVAQWRADAPWIVADAEIAAVIDDIVRIERETAPLRRMVQTAPMPTASEGGRDVEWGSGLPERFGR